MPCRTTFTAGVLHQPFFMHEPIFSWMKIPGGGRWRWQHAQLSSPSGHKKNPVAPGDDPPPEQID